MYNTLIEMNVFKNEFNQGDICCENWVLHLKAEVEELVVFFLSHSLLFWHSGHAAVVNPYGCNQTLLTDC